MLCIITTRLRRLILLNNEKHIGSPMGLQNRKIGTQVPIFHILTYSVFAKLLFSVEIVGVDAHIDPKQNQT